MLLLPSEVLQNVFSFLSYSEIYRLRRVCKSWKLQCEHNIYSSIKSRQQKLSIKVGGKGSTSYIDVLPYDYDYEDQAIEFKTRSSLSEDTDKESDDDVDVPSIDGDKKIQVLFSKWEEKPIGRNVLSGLSINDRTLTLFHLNYNPSLEQCYKLLKTSVRNTSRLRYIGGKGMVVCFSYIYPDTLRSHTTSIPPVRIRVHYVHVNLSWIISGLDTTVSAQTLYKRRYDKLDNILSDYDITEYSLYTEPVLQYIMMDIKKDNNDKKEESIFVLPIKNEKSRVEQLESELLSIGIDPRIMYKYTFSKTFIIKDQSNYNNAKEVAEVIQQAEEGWNRKRIEFKDHLLNME